MKAKSTLSRYAPFLLSLFFVFANLNSWAQRCGFTSVITNGSVINLCVGSSVNLSAQPNGGAYSFQWQKQTSAGGPFADVAGANLSSYSTNTLGAYRVLINNGTCTDTSGITNLIRIAVEGGTISGGPSAPICPGVVAGLLTGSLVPGTDVGIINYQWERNINSTGWSTIVGATTADYLVGFIDATTQFRRVAKDNCGNQALSNVITIQSTPPINAGSITPMSQTINNGATAATLTSTSAASGGSGNLSYQWSSARFERGPFTAIPGATAASYAPGVLSQTTYYARTTVDNTCPNSKSTDVAVVLVTGGTLNAGYFTSAANCFFTGQAAAYLQTQASPSGGMPPYTVDWQSSVDNVTFTSIPGANGFIYEPGVLTQSTYFRKKITDAAGSIAFSQSEKISLIATVLTGGSISSASLVSCIGSSPSPILSTASAGGFGEKISYQWQYSTNAAGPWINFVGEIRESYVPEPINVKTFYRRAAIDACGSNTRTAFSNVVEIDTRPALIAGTISPAAQTIFSGGIPRQLMSTENPSGGTGSYTISWEMSSLAVGPFTTIAGASGFNYQPSNLTQTTYYRRVIKDNNCLAIKYSYVVEVTVVVVNTDPLIGGKLAGSNCVFPGNRPSLISTNGILLVSGGTKPYTFQWEKRTGFAGPFTVIANTNTESYQPEIINATSQYRRRVSDANGLTAYSDTFTIEYHTSPLIPGTIKATTPLLICDNSIPGIILSATSMSGFGEAASYQWQIKIGNGVWTNIDGQIRENYSPTAAITERTAFRRLARDECGGVKRSAISNEVIFELAPKITFKAGLVDGPFITCAGTAPGRIMSVLDACGTGDIKYQWEINTGAGWSNISGATTPSYTPAVLNANTIFRRRAVDGCGYAGYSNEVMIYVYPPIEAGIIGAASQTVCLNKTPELISLLTNCHYTDGTVTYQWQSANSANGPWSNVAGALSNSYQPPVATTNMYYRLRVSSTTCSFQAFTNVASVLVDASCTATPPIAPTFADRVFKIYPNPVSGNVLKILAETKGRVTARMQAADGQVIPVQISRVSQTQLEVKLPDNLSQGTYILQVFDNNSRWTEKVILQ